MRQFIVEASLNNIQPWCAFITVTNGVCKYHTDQNHIKFIPVQLPSLVLIVVSVVEDFLWITFRKSDTIDVTPLICDQQSAGASSKDNIE